jgi:hypothetical protein
MRHVPQRIGLVGGVNLQHDPRTIRPNQLARSKNAFPVIPGILGKRYGVGAARDAIKGSGTLYVMPIAYGAAPAQSGVNHLMHVHLGRASGSSSYLMAASLNGTELSPQTDGAGVTVGAGQTSYEPTRFLLYRGAAIAVVPGVEGYYTYQRKQTGEAYEWVHNSFFASPALIAGQETQAIPVTPRNACVYKNRVVWGNFGPGMTSWLCFADKATSLVFSKGQGFELPSIIGQDALSYNGRHVEVGSIEGESIVAMQEISLGAVGSAMDSVLLLLTEKSCVLISGEILQTEDTDADDPNGLFGSYQENKVNYACGCVSQDTLVKTPYGWIWAGPDDVWLLRGNMPERIGTNIRPALLDTPSTGRSRWSAAYSNGVYVLQLVKTSSTTQDLSTDQHGANVEVTTDIHEYWYLDLRDGVPENANDAAWYGPMVLDIEEDELLVMGKIFSMKQDDGQERVIIPAHASGFGLQLYDMFINSSGRDELVSGEVTAPEWEASTEYHEGDVVRPRNTINNAGRTGRMHVCTASSGAFLSGASEPTWSTSNGGTTSDNDLTWTEIVGSASLGVSGITGKPTIRTNMGRAYGAFTVDIRSRDSLLEDNVFEKLVRRADMNIQVANKLSIGMSVIKDNGASSQSLGSNTFGAESLQGDIDILSASIGGAKAITKTFRPAETELIQCRHAQIKVEDSTAYIIDDTNDYLILTPMFNDGGALSPRAYVQVQLTQGTYDTIDDLLTHIVALLNAVEASLESALGWVLPTPTFSYSSAYSSVFPYFTRINMAYTSLPTDNHLMLVGGDEDTTLTGGNTFIGTGGTTAYLTRSKQLMAMLGFYTGRTEFTGLTLTHSFGSETPVWVGGFDSLSSPIRLDGSQIVPKYNAQRFDIPNLTLTIQPKGAIPLKYRSRS